MLAELVTAFAFLASLFIVTYFATRLFALSRLTAEGLDGMLDHDLKCGLQAWRAIRCLLLPPTLWL